MSTAKTAPAARNSTGSQSAADPASSHHLAEVMLGGQRVLHRRVGSDEDAHDLVLSGIPAAAMANLVAGVSVLSSGDILSAIGVSQRSFARRKATPRSRLPVDEGERLWRFAEILAKATGVFGSQEAAEQWLGRPAVGLVQQKPIDLLRTSPGARLVGQYLTRIEHGVYT